MAHMRKDTLVKAPQDWKHLRPLNKRLAAKHERDAAKREIMKEAEVDRQKA